MKSALDPHLLVTQRTIRDAQISPDGLRVAYAVGEVSREHEHPRGQIWMVSFSGGDARPFTSGPGLDSSPQWSPDGVTLAFLSDREEAGKLALYTIPTGGGEARRAGSEHGEASLPRWSPDGRLLAYCLKEPETEEEEQRKKDKDDVNVVGERLKYTRLHVLDIDTHETVQVTPDHRQVTDYAWAPDGERLAVLSTKTPEIDAYFTVSSLESYSRQGGEGVSIAEVRGPIESICWSPDGLTLAYLGTARDAPTAGSVFVLPSTGGEARDLTEGYEGTAASVGWAPDGTLRVCAFEGLHGALNKLDLEGHVEAMLPPELRGGGSFTPPVSWSADGTRYAAICTSGMELEDVWGGEVGGKLARLACSNPELEATLRGRMAPISWYAADGKEIQGLLVYPAAYETGQKHPLVVQPHGGPAWLWSARAHANWHDWGQWLATHGYAVLLPNPRGSTGRGAASTRANYDDIGGGEWTDVLAGVDAVVGMGIADPERLGIGGWSWGGYLTAWGITQTDRFKAAIVGAGVTDLYSDQGQNDIPHYNDYLFGPTAYSDPLDFLRRSPLFHVNHITTPVLILHGETDERVTVAQGRELYGALKYLGKEVQMATYPREGHSIQERNHQLDLLRRVLDWYDQHLKG